MVILFDGWQIDSDEFQFILGKRVSFTNEKGEPAERVDKITYHPSLSGAIRAFYRVQVRECMADGEYTLHDAMARLQDTEARIMALVREPNFKEGCTKS